MGLVHIVREKVGQQEDINIPRLDTDGLCVAGQILGHINHGESRKGMSGIGLIDGSENTNIQVEEVNVVVKVQTVNTNFGTINRIYLIKEVSERDI